MTGSSDPLDLARSHDRAAPRPKRFYKTVDVAEGGDGYVVMLDQRRLMTPGRATLTLSDRALAEAVAAEWNAQEESVNAAAMPLTQIANAAIDAVSNNVAATRDDIVSYAGNDLICYRAAIPAGLAARQSERWDPLLDWSEQTLGARLVTGEGIKPIQQSDRALASIGHAITAFNPLPLAALHGVTTLTGSAIIAFAVAFKRLSPDDAWNAAHVDEDWQLAQWGEDAEATARREARWREMEAASLILGSVKLG